jgi:hypothetical protein
MNKSFSLVFSLLIAFALFFSTVLPVSAAGLTLSTVSASRSGKVKLTFEVDGAPPASSNTFVHTGWASYPLNCHFNENQGILVCFIYGNITKHAGNSAWFTLGGQDFSITIPEKPQQICVASAANFVSRVSLSQDAPWFYFGQTDFDNSNNRSGCPT